MHRKTYLGILFIVTIVNFIAQIPYYFHQYHLLPSLSGVILMSFVFAWFLVSFWWLWNRMQKGYLLILIFLIVEFLFYMSTQITQAVSGRGILLHVLHPNDPVLFIVFGIGYINLLASGFFISYLLLHKKQLIH
jgi:hypothetical protein